MKIEFFCAKTVHTADEEDAILHPISPSLNDEQRIVPIFVVPFTEKFVISDPSQRLLIKMKDKKDYGFFVPGETYVMEFSKLAKEPNSDEITPEEASKQFLPNF